MQTRNIPLTVALLALAAALSACETTGGGPSPQAAAPTAPPTRQQAALDCWMATEKDAVKLGLDKRADVVTKCMAEVMAGKSTDAAVADSEGKPQAKPKTAGKPQTKPTTTGALPKVAAKPKSDAGAKPDAKPDAKP